jgi:hypothetical protein
MKMIKKILKMLNLRYPGSGSTHQDLACGEPTKPWTKSCQKLGKKLPNVGKSPPKRGQKNVKTWAKDRHNMSTSLEQKSDLDKKPSKTWAKASQNQSKRTSKRGQKPAKPRR